ncbi:MAG: M1 family metallopeptidase, partial [Myxococcota bacterium]
MRRQLVVLSWLTMVSGSVSAAELPATSIAYEIEVRLDPQTRDLDGTLRVRWINESTTTVTSVPMHLYLNAFSNEESTWIREVSIGRFETDEFLDLYPEPWGYSDLTSVRQGDSELEWLPIAPDDGNPLDRTLVEVTLADPIPPGQTLVLDVVFKARLPIPIARTGGFDNYFLVSQWFPKIAVFEHAGVRHAKQDRWVRHQFHGGTEFYADFADFDVRIGVPPGWMLSATGTGGRLDHGPDAAHDWYRYEQRAVHDFAFVTSSILTETRSQHDPTGPGGPVEIRVLVPVGMEHQVPRWRRAVEGALDVLGSRVGPYPYASLTLVMSRSRGSRTMGMEYPTLIGGMIADPIWDGALFGDFRGVEFVIVHELAHQYFYGLVATNEFEEAFMDEGFTEYWSDEIMHDVYGDPFAGGALLGRGFDVYDFGSLGLAGSADEIDEPVRGGPSYLFQANRIGPQFYRRPSSIFQTAARHFGQPAVDAVFAAYFARYAFHHPDFDDFLDVARATGGTALADFLVEAFESPTIPDFRVAEFDVSTWEPPRGRVITDAGPVTVSDETRHEQPRIGLDEAALETDGRVLMEITDPGWIHAGRRQTGSIERRWQEPERLEANPEWEAEEDEFRESRVRLEGPGLQHLPVEVVFRFADGVVLRDLWDGKSPRRIYRFLRAAPLDEVRM